MRKLKNNKCLQLQKYSIAIGMLFMLFSCDFGTQVSYSYSSSQDADESIYIGWNSDGDCYVYIDDESLDYDNVAVMFPTDESPIISFQTSYYSYLYDDAGLVKVDSTFYIDERLNLSEDDDRVLSNDSLYISVFKGTKSIFKQTLYREKRETEFIDRLPIPKIHG